MKLPRLSVASRLNRRDRRALLLGSLVLAPVLLFRCGVRPYMAERSEAHTRLAIERAHYSRELELVASSGRFPELTQHAEKSLAREAVRLFSGPNEVAAEAELVTYIEATAKQSQVLLEGAEGRGPRADSLLSARGIARLEVEIQGQSDLQGVLEFLAALEGGPKLVHIDDLRIDRVEPVATGSDSGPTDVGELAADSAAVTDGMAVKPAVLRLSAILVGFSMRPVRVEESPSELAPASRVKGRSEAPL